jgi:thiol-disulfide isomerase/thioredoxin
MRWIIFIFLVSSAAQLQAQPLKSGPWKAAIVRQDGEQIVFNFDLRYTAAKQPVIYIINATERLKVNQIIRKKDSVFIEMPFFESSFACQLLPDGSLKGNWIKATSGKSIVVPFMAKPGAAPRFVAHHAPLYNISGRWAMQFSKKTADQPQPAIAELKQVGSRLTGSILTPSGDYRFLEGIVSADSLILSTFDGSHAYTFKATISDAQTLTDGRFYAGATSLQLFKAQKNDTASLSMASVAMFLKPDQDRLNFAYPDLDGKLVAMDDDKFRNKVVVLQIMGSWCPNCMDETAFLSNYYKKNHQRGIEMIALAYEYSTDKQRSKKSLQKFQQRFAVDYPILNTGVTASDTLKTEKTLPQLTAIKSFPSTVFVGKDGLVKKVHGGFFGPATGEAYTKYIQEFEQTIAELLNQ